QIGTASAALDRRRRFMAMAGGVVACGTAACDRARVRYAGRNRAAGDCARLAKEANHQLVAFETGIDQQGLRRTKAKIDVVPVDPGIAALRRGGAGHNTRMGMALDDLAAGLKCRVIERVG